MEVVASFCDCAGSHKIDCNFGKRMRIKYHPVIKKVWDLIGGEETEKLIDELMEGV